MELDTFNTFLMYGCGFIHGVIITWITANMIIGV